MKEYLPWSQPVYNATVNDYRNGKMDILDIQLGGSCPYNCIYCDSPDRNKPCLINFDHLYEMVENARAERKGFSWVFVCGLGEPIWGVNKSNLLNILKMCENFNMKCTIFTNGNQIDEQICDFVEKEILYPIIKLDTLSISLASEIYGTELEQAERTLYSTEVLFDISRRKNNEHCNVAASIVPSTKNKHEMLDLVRLCVDNNVFPLLGQLEFAGSAKKKYRDLMLSNEELIQIKQSIEAEFGVYSIPICPSVISGFHITHNGMISVDEKSGLSCSWFWLEDPQIIELCNINAISSFDIAYSKIMDYRNRVLGNVERIAPTIEEHPFGGCGGNIKDLVDEYILLQKNISR